MTLRPLALCGLLIAASSGAFAIYLLDRAPVPGRPPAAAERPAAAAPAPAAPVAAGVPALPVPQRGAESTVPAADRTATLSLAEPATEVALPAAKDEVTQLPARPQTAEDASAAIINEAVATDEAAPADGGVILLTVKAQRGDTLARLLVDAGVPRNDAQAVVDSLGKVFDPRDLKPGHEIQLRFQADDDPEGRARSLGRLQGVNLAAAIDREVQVTAAAEGGFVAEAMTKQVSRLVARSNGEITGGSLLAAGMVSGVPASVMTEMIRIFSFDVDFQRDIQPGDRFDLMYERFHLADGRLVRGGDVMYAALTLSGKTLRLYRYNDSSGRLDYYNELGHSVRKALLKTPIDGARLTSRFGMREHPILGYSIMHRGVDFGAPTGTPIFAAGDGTVDDLGERSGYGRYIRVRHSGTYATAYAHMSGYGRGLKKGMRVRQGQVIGYVGATGRATGPHLHFEVMRDGKQVNPVTVKFPTGEKLAGAELARFQAIRNDLDRSLPSAQMALEYPPRQEIGAGR
ncbi:MAG: M23 family metallopeptidase [Alphaproteobacteria bacterium]|nr:M23 family metallopeptidase [Alphaproteobacteria bacterium]